MSSAQRIGANDLALVRQVAREATNDEAKLFARHFRSTMTDYKDANYPIDFFGTPMPAVDVDAGVVPTRDHWLTWRIDGAHCILVQCNPDAKKRKKTSSSPDGGGDGDDEPQQPPPPPLYLVLPNNRLFIVRAQQRQSFRRFNPRSSLYSYPTVALEGFLTRRVRSTTTATAAEHDTLRRASLRTLTHGESLDDRLRSNADIVFLAFDCLWSRVSRATDEMQQRASLARQIIEGDPHQNGMLTERVVDSDARTLNVTSIEYMPSMPSITWQAIISDVPPVVRGCALRGVLFRNANAKHTRIVGCTTFVIDSVDVVRRLMHALRTDDVDDDDGVAATTTATTTE